MTNSEILRTPASLLGSLDRQRQFILKVAQLKMPCPACGHPTSQMDAAQRDLNDFPVDSLGGESLECPACSRPLDYVVPLMGPMFQWFIKDLAAPNETARINAALARLRDSKKDPGPESFADLAREAMGLEAWSLAADCWSAAAGHTLGHNRAARYQEAERVCRAKAEAGKAVQS